MISWLDENLEKYFLALGLGTISILVFVQVVMRYAFGASLDWSEELIRWVFIWSIWIGVSYAFKNDQHMKISTIADKLSGNAKFYIQLFVAVICLLFIARIGWYGYEQATSRLIMRQSAFSIPNPFGERNLSVMYLYLSVPVGCLFSSIRLMQNIVKLIKNKGEK